MFTTKAELQEIDSKLKNMTLNSQPQPYVELIEAMYKGALHKVQEFVDSGVTISQRGEPNAETVLHIAAKWRDGELMRIILGHPEAVNLVNTKDGIDFTPLMYAVEYENLEVVRLLLEKGASISDRGKKDITCRQDWTECSILHMAARTSDETILQELFKHPDACFFLNDKDIWGRTPLKYAVESGNLEGIRLLLHHGALFTEPGKNVSTELHIAANLEDVSILLDLLQHPNAWALLDDEHPGKKTPLDIATDAENVKAVKVLLESGADIEHRDGLGLSILHTACISADVTVLCELLKHPDSKAILNEAGVNGETPIMYAAKMGNQDAVRVLLENGAQSLVDDIIPCTPLHTAADGDGMEKLNDFSNVPDFLALVNDGDAQDLTPLMLAVKRGDIDSVHLLLENGVSFECRDNMGCSVVHLASDNGDVVMLQELLKDSKAIALVNSADCRGSTPLMKATRNGNLGTIRLLLENGALPTLGDKDWSSVLHFAALKNDTEVLCELLSAPNSEALVNHADEWGFTPLMNAAWNGKSETIQILLEKGATLLSKDLSGNREGKMICLYLREDNYSALDYGVRNRDVRVLRDLLKHPEAGSLINRTVEYGMTPLLFAVESFNIEAFHMLLENGACLKHLTEVGESVLHIAVRRNTRTTTTSAAFLSELLKHPDATSLLDVPCKYGYTPLHSAVRYHNTDAVHVLLEHGARFTNTPNDPLFHSVMPNCPKGKFDNGMLHELLKIPAVMAFIDETNMIGYTPLMSAVKNGNVEAVHLLLENGADFTCMDKNGLNLLHMAVEYNGMEVLLELLQHPSIAALVNVEDGHGCTLLLFARRKRNKKAVQILLEHGV